MIITATALAMAPPDWNPPPVPTIGLNEVVTNDLAIAVLNGGELYVEKGEGNIQMFQSYLGNNEWDDVGVPVDTNIPITDLDVDPGAGISDVSGFVIDSSNFPRLAEVSNGGLMITAQPSHLTGWNKVKGVAGSYGRAVPETLELLCGVDLTGKLWIAPGPNFINPVLVTGTSYQGNIIDATVLQEYNYAVLLVMNAGEYKLVGYSIEPNLTFSGETEIFSSDQMKNSPTLGYFDGSARLLVSLHYISSKYDIEVINEDGYVNIESASFGEIKARFK